MKIRTAFRGNPEEQVSVRARAPLRLGFAGGGTDVSPFCDQYGGAVLNATIGMYAYATLQPRFDGMVQFEICERDQSLAFPLSAPPADKSDFALHFGVYERVIQDFCQGEPFGVTIRTHCDAPAGSGLGSSSTLVVAMLTAFQELMALPLGEYEVAHLAYEIERLDLNMAGGKQDQYAAAFGGVNFMEFFEKGRVIVNPLRVKWQVLAELEASLVLYFTGVSRSSAAIIKQQVTNMAAKNSDNDTIRAGLELKSDAFAIKESLLKGDIRQFGEVLNKSWAAKKKMAQDISNADIDQVYDHAVKSGAYAGKVSGAGGGGFMMFLCDPSNRPALIKELRQFGGQCFTPHFVERGADAWRRAAT